jgi:hypothetical protein
MILFYKASVLLQLLLAFIINERNKTEYMLYLLTSNSKERRDPPKFDDENNKKRLKHFDTIFEAPNDKYSLFLER